MEPTAGNAPAPQAPEFRLGSFVGALLSATRPHFFAFPVGAALAGVASANSTVAFERLVMVSIIAGGGWGAGQLLNDVLDRDADAVDAPHRPAVRGLLPPRRTIGLALCLGLGLLGLLTTLTPSGWLLGVVSMGFILTYNSFKRHPVAGNLAHGALLSVAALIGVAVALPDAPLLSAARAHWRALAVVGLWAALYLQANYEKDVRGDAAAGYRTIAHVLGVRWSSLIRSVLIVGTCWLATPLLRDPVHHVVAWLAAGVISAAALRTAHHNTAHAALQGYRSTVHGGTLGMLAFGGAALPLPVFVATLMVAAALTEWAFTKSPNP